LGTAIILAHTGNIYKIKNNILNNSWFYYVPFRRTPHHIRQYHRDNCIGPASNFHIFIQLRRRYPMSFSEPFSIYKLRVLKILKVKQIQWKAEAKHKKQQLSFRVGKDNNYSRHFIRIPAQGAKS